MRTKKTTLDSASLLHDAGLRATPGRMQLLETLARETKPLAVHQLEERMGGTLNQVTLYRALEALVTAGVITRVNLEHEHAHYELAVGRAHHHHAICTSCGLVEDIDVAHATTLKKGALQAAPAFSRIDRYSLEFFGLCKACS